MSAQRSQMDTLMATIEELSVEIGPRGSTSDEERRASEYVANYLRTHGFETSIESFRSVTSFSWAFGIFFAAFVIAATLLAIGTPPIIPALISLLALIAFGLESSGIETITRLLPQRPSQNVIGRIQPTTSASHHVVVTAHVDSSRSALLWHPRIAGIFRPLLLLAIAAMLLITILSVVAIFMPVLWPRLVAWIACIYIACMLFILVDREFRGSITPGANDNASGVAVLLSLADSFATHPLAPDTDVWLVATGCEEAGTVGMLRFLQRHGNELPKATTTFINIDNVGAGEITFTTAEGILLPLKTDPVLNEAAIAFAQNYPEYHVKGHGYHALTTDAIIPLSKRRRAISIMAFDARGRLPNWHWHTDTIDNIDPETITIARDLVAYVIRSIAW